MDALLQKHKSLLAFKLAELAVPPIAAGEGRI
jgi:hypothetical protein